LRDTGIKMARANRHFISGYPWHLTHSCHKRKFLLKFAKYKQRWMHWLFEAKKRFGLCVLNFTVTSNHNQMGYKANGLKDIENGNSFLLREPQTSYQSMSDKAAKLQPEDNKYYWPNGSDNYPDSNMSLKGSF